MAKEIEKKYLVKAELLPELNDGSLYIQGYLSINPLIRFRIKNNSAIITIKKVSSDGISRDEWEFEKEISDEDINGIVSLAVKKPISKKRYKLEFKGFIWEIDVYQGDNLGLITADIEIPTQDTDFVFPDWIDSTKEITNDPKYFNVNLGDNPYCNWNKS